MTLAKLIGGVRSYERAGSICIHQAKHFNRGRDTGRGFFESDGVLPQGRTP